MKLTAIILFVATIQVSARSDGQNVTLDMKDAPLQNVFKEVSRQTGISIIYNEAMLKDAAPVTIKVKDLPFRQVLDQCLTGLPLAYSIENNAIIVKQSPKKIQDELLPLSIDVKGRVVNENGEPVAGASIQVKGDKTKGTSTDVNGYFELKGVDENAILVISGVSIETREIEVNGRSDFIITVKIAITQGEGVTINAGYYKVTDRNRTGNISRVDSKTIERQPVSNLLSTISGRMPGVYIQQNTGIPGGGISIKIRGLNSLRSDGNYPLYLIDGVPFTSLSLNSSNVSEITPLANPLNSINPNDIESIEILKDADATSIYGSRGANGVVLITTKKGKAGKTSFNLNLYQGFSRVTKKMKLLNTTQYLEMRNEANRNDGIVANSANSPDLFLWDTTRYTDWQKELIGGTASTTNIQTTISGGNSNTQFLLSGGYYRETTVFPGDFYFQKGSGHFNLNHHSPNNKFNLDFSISYSADNNNLTRQDLTQQAIRLQPVAPKLYDNNGNLNWENSTWANPLASLLSTYKSNTNNMVTSVTVGYAISKNLSLRSYAGYTNLLFRENNINPRAAFNPFGNFNSSVSWGNNRINTWIIEPQLEYNKNISKGTIQALIGSSFQESNSENETFLATGFPSDAFLTNPRAATSINMSRLLEIKYRYNALFARFNFAWERKYFLNLTARRDGSTRFSPGNQFGNFGAAGLAWIFTEEPFVQKSFGFLSFGKLRTSYGITGSDQIPDYGFLNSYSTSSYSYQGTGIYPTRLTNADYGWETNKKFEASLDLGFLKDRIQLSTSYYRNISSSQLVGYALPATTGQSTIQANFPATVRNTGWEFELALRNIESSGFKWTTALNLTIPDNVLLKFPNISGSSYANTYEVGKSLYVLKRFHFTGVDPQTGVYTFEDVDGNGSGTNSPADLQTKKEISQRFFGGFQNTVKFKGFEFDIFFQFVKQTGRNYLNSFTQPPGSRFSNQPTIVMNRWQNPGDISDIQAFTTSSITSRGRLFRSISSSDQMVSDASFIRLKNIEISYSLSSILLSKIKLENCRIYLRGQNLLTITNYLGLDPENQLSTVLPPLKTLAFGVQLTF